MSRYVLLVVLNLPLIIASLINALVDLKMRKISGLKFWARTLLWLALLAGLATAYPVYNFLFSKNLTNTEPLSLFDVIQITAIVFVFFIANRTARKIETLERRVQDLHQELSIKLSAEQKKN